MLIDHHADCKVILVREFLERCLDSIGFSPLLLARFSPLLETNATQKSRHSLALQKPEPILVASSNVDLRPTSDPSRSAGSSPPANAPESTVITSSAIPSTDQDLSHKTDALGKSPFRQTSLRGSPRRSQSDSPANLIYPADAPHRRCSTTIFE